MTVPGQLLQVAEETRNGQRRWKKIKTLLSWFDQKGRGKHVVETIREALREVGLDTEPDFALGSVHNYVEFKLASAKGDRPEDSCSDVDGSGSEDREGGESEPVEETEADSRDPAGSIGTVFRIGMLEAANRPSEVLTVKRDDKVTKAHLLMIMHDYSQLPVTQDMRKIDGMISWRSIGQARVKGQSIESVRDCLEPIYQLQQDAPFFQAVEEITKREVVLVMGTDLSIAGIVTTNDLSREFHKKAEPFLLLEQVEEWIRALISKNLSPEEIGAAEHSSGDMRQVDDAFDLDFGQYVRLLESRENWNRLGLEIDRKEFRTLLDDVREVRNDVMHFRPDSSQPESLDKVRMLHRLLEQLFK